MKWEDRVEVGLGEMRRWERENSDADVLRGRAVARVVDGEKWMERHGGLLEERRVDRHRDRQGVSVYCNPAPCTLVSGSVLSAR